jgi:hypothetical protein
VPEVPEVPDFAGSERERVQGEGRPEASSQSLLLYFTAVRGAWSCLPKFGQASDLGALGGIRTPNLLIRRGMEIV